MDLPAVVVRAAARAQVAAIRLVQEVAPAVHVKAATPVVLVAPVAPVAASAPAAVLVVRAVLVVLAPAGVRAGNVVHRAALGAGVVAATKMNCNHSS